MIAILGQASAELTDAGTVSTVLFYVFAILTGGSALCVVLSRNIVRTAVALLFTLAGVAGLYFLLSAEFLAAVQLVVYAGGTLILIIFGVMLTSKSQFAKFEPKLGEVIVAMSVGVIMLFVLILGIFHTKFAGNALSMDEYPVAKLGQVLLGDYLVPFEIISVLLLVVMIGAAYLAKGRKRDEPRTQKPTLSKAARQWS
jgi:NADH:ubiquinone oxidoreductase subunit 6 (subunit J)